VLKLLKKLFSGPAGAAAPPSDPMEYEGYSVVATPRQVSGGWSTEGTISKEVDGELRQSRFIRADTCMSREDAVQMAFRKARTIIEEQGERMFR
jgi:hypothetical protein